MPTPFRPRAEESLDQNLPTTGAARPGLCGDPAAQPPHGPLARGQSSLELLIMFGVFMMFTVSIFTVASTFASDNLVVSQAQDAVQRMASAADYVYALGPNTREYITIYIPKETETVNVSGNLIHLRVRINSGPVDIYQTTSAPVVDALSANRGRQRVLVQYLPSGKVLLGESGLTCSPPFASQTFQVGGSASQTVSLANNGPSTAEGMQATVSGAVASLVSAGAPPDHLFSGQTGNLTLSFNVPSNTPSGLYSGELLVASTEDACVTAITVQVDGATSCASLCNSGGYSTGTCRALPSACVAASEDYQSAYDAACSGGTPRCCCGPTQDTQGPLVSAFSVSPANASVGDNLTLTALCNDTGTGNSYIAQAQVQVDNGEFWEMTGAGAFNATPTLSVSRWYAPSISGQHIASVRCQDSAGNTGPLTPFYFNVSAADTIGPLILSINHTPTSATALTNITLVATGSDALVGNSNISGCYAKADNGNWTLATASDGAYDSPTEAFGHSFGNFAVGVHTIYAYCVDARNNTGGTYNDTFGVTAADIMIIIDRSGSMAEPITYASDNSAETTTSSSFTLIKSATVSSKNGDAANTSVQIHSSKTSCAAIYETRIGSAVVATGSTTSTGYVTFLTGIDLANYTAPITLDLYMRRSTSSCTVYAQNFNVTQMPSKMDAAKYAAKAFVDVMGSSSLGGVASFSDSGSTQQTFLSMAGAANVTAVKNAIDSLSPGGGTCIECGLDEGVDEEISARSRYPNSNRFMVLLSDGQSNAGDSTTGATYARNNNVTVYTIGIGNADGDELTNVALLTHGQYSYAPDQATLLYIYQHIGQ